MISTNKITLKLLYKTLTSNISPIILKRSRWFRRFLSAIKLSMTLDTDKYLPYLQDTSLSLEQKKAIICTVWGLMESQVHHAFQKQATAVTQTQNESTVNISPFPIK